MARTVLPQKADSKFYRNMAHDLDDGFGTFMTCAIVTITSGIVTGILTTYSLYFLLLILPALFLCRVGINLFKNSIPIPSYSPDRSLYSRAYSELISITEPNSYEDAKALATNVWNHEESLAKMGKNHISKGNCPDCHKRVELISNLRDAQPLPYIDGSDIERIEQKLKARRELAA